MTDLLESCKALLDLDKKGALVPHGLGGHGRDCLTWAVGEIGRLRAFETEMLEALRLSATPINWTRPETIQMVRDVLAKAECRHNSFTKG